MVGMQARLLIALTWRPGLQATPHPFERMAVYELYFCPTNMQIFELNTKKTWFRLQH